MRLTGKRIFEWSEWTSQPMLVLYGLALAYKLRYREVRFFDFYLPLFMLAHFFYEGTGGNQYGPRYYFPALPFVVLTTLTAAASAWRRLDGAAAAPRARARAVLCAALAMTFVLMVLYVPLWSARTHAIVAERLDLYRQVAERGLSGAVVLIADGTSPTRPMPPYDLTRNGIELRGPVLYAHDRGAGNAELLARYPERTFWLYRRPDGEAEGELIPYVPATGF